MLTNSLMKTEKVVFFVELLNINVDIIQYIFYRCFQFWYLIF